MLVSELRDLLKKYKEEELRLLISEMSGKEELVKK